MTTRFGSTLSGADQLGSWRDPTRPANTCMRAELAGRCRVRRDTSVVLAVRGGSYLACHGPLRATTVSRMLTLAGSMRRRRFQSIH